MPDAVELVIEGTGPGPQLRQSLSGSSWQGQLFTAAPSGLSQGPQRVSLPEAGFQSISFDGSGSTYTISVTPAPGVNLGRPVVSADGRDLILTFAAPVPQARLQVNRLNMAQPGAVPLPTYAPPLQPRAVAPPLGDMAVGTMTMRSPGLLNVSGPPVTMTLRNAPAKDALMALAQLGGYGFAYVEDPNVAPEASRGSRPISLAFRNESYSTALNTALISAGLQGKREGNVIFAGTNALGSGIGAQVSKVYRLNQVGPNAAADYLANLGATVTKTDTIITSVTSGVAEAELVARGLASQTTQSQAITEVREFGASRGPLVGLRATTDTRLGTITMIGAPEMVAIGEQYLKQLDLRQRQVALRVQILDVNLDNASEIDNSFAFRFGNNFIVNDSGRLLGAFGRNLPPAQDSFQRRAPDSIELDIGPDGARFSTENAPPNIRLFGEGADSRVRSLRTGSNVPNPGIDYPDGFFNFIRAQIVSGSTKLLASPTLILQENPSLLREGADASGLRRGSGSANVNSGLAEFDIDSPIGRRRANEGAVRVGTNVVTGFDTESPAQGGNIVCTPQLATAGLILGARVEKIDDNGFVTFTLSPSVSAITGQEPAPAGCGSNLNILSVRTLDTGALRVRDGQTLIMTGVISEFDREEVRKWPILGDIPLIGQFFRASGRSREKRELVIMVTPRIIRDDDGGVFGYGYLPGTDQVRDFFGTQLQNGNGF
jgi:type IV pilus assembly protein PilQ